MKNLDGIGPKAKEPSSKVVEKKEPEAKPLIFETPKISTASKNHTHLNIGSGSPFSKKNMLLGFILIIVAIILVLLAHQAIGARNKLLSLEDSLQKNLDTIDSFSGGGNLERALNQITKMQNDLKQSKLIAQAWGQDMSYLQYVPGKKSSLTQKELLLDSGYDISNFSDDLKGTMGDLKSSDNQIDLNLLSANLEKATKNFNKKITHYRGALKGSSSKESDRIDSNLKILQDKIAGVNNFLSRGLPWLSGANGVDNNILIIFQNNGELRGGSGGSLGSFGVLKFSGGRLVDISFGQNIYKLDQPFEAQTHIEPPDIIKFLDPNWTLKDAGWSADGPTAFSDIEDFYQKETGNNVNGVITVDATFFEELLQKIGPINLPKYGKTLDSKNFRSEVEQEVHIDYFNNAQGIKENEPKKILGEMIPLVLDKIFASLSNKDQAVGILGVVSSGLKEKHLLLYFNDQSMQGIADESNWSGEVNHSMGDYLYVNNSNIAGGKSSINIDEALNLDVTVGEDGSVSDKLVISRNYTARDGNDNNVNFVRLGLPENSKLNGFDPVSGNYQQFWDRGLKDNKYYWENDEFSKHWLNYWMSTPSSGSSELSLSYVPAYKVVMDDNITYQLLIQKQPGSLSDVVKLTIHYPKGYKPTNIKNYDKKNRTATIKLNLEGDLNIKLKFAKE